MILSATDERFYGDATDVLNHFNLKMAHSGYNLEERLTTLEDGISTTTR